ncbi:hypothetical protein D3C73_824460 [compost metagenome]|uniref:ATP-dependent nuclease n=1 Tax=Brevundimonas diminuta TaxID=293 RepID=UPI000FB58A27
MMPASNRVGIMTATHQRTLRRLGSKFVPAQRHSNFGRFLEAIHIRGIRGIGDLRLDFRFPVSVISGANGSGKSTFAHTALCVHNQSIDGAKKFNISHFFFQSEIDKALFADDAEIFAYYTWDVDPSPRYARIYRNVDRWRGYDRRPVRGIVYIGLLVYLPKVERRDLSVYARTRLRRGARTSVGNDVRSWINIVLGTRFTAVDVQNLHDRYREIDIFCVARGATANYSESNMGLGEGRVIKMITEIEAAPPKSLIVIDEPEIALHEAAQSRFAHYLVSASDRLGHQFIVTSHSHALIGELPTESLIYIDRRAGRVVSVEGATYREAKALLSNNSAENTVWVEDDVSKAILENILRRIDPTLMQSMDVCVLSGGEAGIKASMRSLSKLGIGRIAVLDGDQAPIDDIGVLTLPGSLCPEREVFGASSVIDMLLDRYCISKNDIDHVKDSVDPHGWFFDIAALCGELVENMKVRAISTYVDGLSNEVITEFAARLRGRMEQVRGE